MLEGAWTYGQVTLGCLASLQAGSSLVRGPCSSSGLRDVLPHSPSTRGLHAFRPAGCFTSPICFPATAAIWLLPSLGTFFLTPCFSSGLRSSNA